jgi:predicted metal-dependent TIM-barrel fold hydrolase
LKNLDETDKKVIELNSDCNDQVSKILAIHKTIENMKMTLASQESVAKIKNRLDNFASIEHIDQLKTVLLPKVAKFSE